MELYVIRHGESLANAEGRFSGWANVSLSEKGMQQALQTGAGLKGQHFDRIISSDTLRARQTAERVFPDREYTTDWRLREINVGEILQDWRREDLIQQHGEKILDAMKRRDYHSFGGESYDDQLARVSRFMDDLAEIPDHERVAVVCHEGTIICMLSYILQHKVNNHRLALKNASVSYFVRREGNWKMIKWGETF